MAFTVQTVIVLDIWVIATVNVSLSVFVRTSGFPQRQAGCDSLLSEVWLIGSVLCLWKPPLSAVHGVTNLWPSCRMTSLLQSRMMKLCHCSCRRGLLAVGGALTPRVRTPIPPVTQARPRTPAAGRRLIEILCIPLGYFFGCRAEFWCRFSLKWGSVQSYHWKYRFN